jgi:hypothetical protein
MTLMDLVDDWVSRTICPCWHVRLGAAEDFHAATAWLRQGLRWLDKQEEFADPWSRHALADGNATGCPMPTAIADARWPLLGCRLSMRHTSYACASAVLKSCVLRPGSIGFKSPFGSRMTIGWASSEIHRPPGPQKLNAV